MEIKTCQQEVHDNAVAHGWWENKANITPESILAKLMLVVSEVAEACEETRMPEFGNGFSEYMTQYTKNSKPEGFGIELADAVIRIMDLCEAMGIDLEDCIRIKHEYNKTRPFKHGKTI